MSDTALLAKRVETLDPEFAKRMLKEPTTITPYAADFFKNGAVTHVACNGRYGPVQMNVGVAGDFVVSLLGDPAAYFRLAAKAGLQLDTAARRDAYVRVFLEATKDLSRRTQFLDAFPDYRKTDQTTPAETERYNAIKKALGPIVKPLALSPTAPFKGKAFALVNWDLTEYQVALAADGKITVAVQALEKNMPLCLQLTPK